MRSRLATFTATLVALGVVGPVSAHHSISMFEISAPIWVRGTVVRFEAINPHAIIELEEATNDGSARRWLIEGPDLRRLGRMGAGPGVLQTGDMIEVCGFPPKAEFSSPRPSSGTAGYPPQSLHGHVLIMPGGQMRTWGSYGKLENCIRAGDQVQTWLNFVNTDPMARAAWCISRTFVWAASLPPTEFVDEVNSLMIDPCE